MSQDGQEQEEVEVLTPEEEESAQALLDHGISKSVAKELVDIYSTGQLSQSELDDRAMDALKEFDDEDAIKVLQQFRETDLSHVQNKSAFLCGVMKTYRAKLRQGNPHALMKGPDEAKLKEILDRTGYSLDVTSGQRRYGGPPPGGEPTPPGSGHEVFCGGIPKDVFEDTLIPMFEKYGKIWDMRLMIDSFTGLTKGYGFVTFCEKEAATEAVSQLHNYEISEKRFLKVNISIANVRLFVGSIPKNKSRDEIKDEFSTSLEGLTDVIVYGSADNVRKNRGFAFLEFESHQAASTARRKLASGRLKYWGHIVVTVDWADPQEEPDQETMSKVKVLYVRHLTLNVTEDTLKEKFGAFGKVERVKKIKGYGFVHFEEREDAIKAMEELNGLEFDGMKIEISLAKPPTENKKKEQRKREQDRRSFRHPYSGFDDYFPRGGYGGGRPGGRRPYAADPYFDEYYAFEEDYYYPYPPMLPMYGGRGGRGGNLPPVARNGWPWRGAPWSRGRRSTNYQRGGR